MSNQNDPISQIKKAEEASRKEIEEARKNFEEKFKKAEEDLVKKRGKFEDDLRERGLQKLESVKKEASELLKSRMAAHEKETQKMLTQAQERKAQAVKQISANFLKHIKA